jgi:hypothetical protein
MGYGFVVAYLVFLILGPFVGLIPQMSIPATILVVIGMFGGVLPDVDRWESISLQHRKSLHYPISYGFATLVAVVIYVALIRDSVLLALACFLSAAWLHSFMDIFDDYWLKPEQGVYEHIRGRWIRALEWIPFASTREWSLQSGADVLALLISPSLPVFLGVQGWLVGAGCFALIWLLSTFYELSRTVSARARMVAAYNESVKSSLVEQ